MNAVCGGVSRAVAVVLAVGLCGCGATPRLQPLTPDSVVLAFGDSLTSGMGAESKESYPAVLAGLLGCKVVNAGLSGEGSAAGAKRLPSLLKAHHPDLVIVCHGGNDLLHKLADVEIKRRVCEMVKMAQASGAEVVLVGVPRPDLTLRAPFFYEEVARECRIPYDGKTVCQILSSPSLKSDLIHPNAAGYRSIAESIVEVIRSHQ